MKLVHLVMHGGVSVVHRLSDREQAPGSNATICTLAVSPRMVDSSLMTQATSSGH